MPISVHDLAYELGLSPDKLLIELRMMGRSIGGPSSRITDQAANRLRELFPAFIEPVVPAVRPPSATDRRSSIPLHVFSHDERRALALLELPNPDHTDNSDISQIDLRKLREGLGMSVSRAAATIGVEPTVLHKVESVAGDAPLVRRIMQNYAIHIAAMWAADSLRLGAGNFEP